jgi:hypothetical protein
LRVQSLYLVLLLVVFLSVRADGEDKLYWVPSKGGLFDVRSYYCVLILHDSTPFSLRGIGGIRFP